MHNLPLLLTVLLVSALAIDYCQTKQSTDTIFITN